MNTWNGDIRALLIGIIAGLIATWILRTAGLCVLALEIFAGFLTGALAVLLLNRAVVEK